MTKPLAPHCFRLHKPGLWLSALACVLAAPGCYHATGIQRASAVAEVIPSTNGDRVPGLKSAAGPGDYFVGNDVVCLAVDGVPYDNAKDGTGVPIAGALSGGSIVDAGYVELNPSYKRTSMPTDLLERLTPVVNQDPNLQMVFDAFSVANGASSAYLLMTGGICNVSTGVRMSGVTVTHKISVGESDHFALIETTVTNNTGADLDITSIGDYLIQKGGGYRFNIPAYEDNNGNALKTWGVQIPGTSDFSISASVRAPMVGLMGVEPAAPTYDAHTSLGILPADEDYLLVACKEAQNTLTDTRPKFPSQLVVGKPQASSALGNGKSLTYRRRLYAEGGSSAVGAECTKPYALTYPNQATGLFNRMSSDRYALRPSTASGYGWVVFQTSGSAVRYGGVPTEIRIEDTSGNLVRTEFLESQDCLYTSLATNPVFWLFMPVGTYQLKLQNVQPDQWTTPLSYVLTNFSSTFTSFYNSNDADHPNIKVPLLVVDDPYDGDRTKSSSADFIISGAVLCPEFDQIVSSGSQTVSDTAFPAVSLYAIERNAPTGHLQPLRWTINGISPTPDPDMKRTRSLGSIYNTSTKAKAVSGVNYGCYAFGEGNQVFGTAFKYGAPFTAALMKGNYTLYGTRGPLSLLQSRDIELTTSSSNSYTFIIFPASLPTGWTTFDMPGPSMASTGSLLPVEKLSGALAERIQVVANTEEDLLTDSTALRDEFRLEFDDPANTSRVSDDQRSAVGNDPYILPARSSDLSGMSVGNFGVATALFTPDPTTARNRGARLPNNWTLSDFMKQSSGSYFIVQRPRGPKGLFTGQDPSSVVKATDAWLSGTGSHSYGVLNGGFDAIELICAQSLYDLGSPDAWFSEFKAVRADWFSLLNGQTPSSFTKALGLSSSKFTKDTPVGLARTYLKATGFTQDSLSPIKTALQSGAAVASTGPFLDASIGSTGIGGTATSSSGSVSLTVTVMAGDWVPVDEVRIVVNGAVVATQPFGTAPASHGWAQDGSDSRKWTQTFTVNLAKDSWIVVEGGVPLTTTGTYGSGSAWNKIMKGIYPVAVTNPIFVDYGADGYTAPGY